MNQHLEPDPLEALRAVDPVDADHLSSASLARIRARVSEETMNTPTAPRVSRPVRVLGLLGGGVAAVALALALTVGGRGGVPLATPGASVGTGSAMCVEQYSLDALANRTFAFDGTVQAIDGDSVTFAVNSAYRGATGDTITLEAAGMTGTSITSAGGPNLAVGERYLVAGDDRFVWACGFTQPYDAGVAGDWAAALAG